MIIVHQIYGLLLIVLFLLVSVVPNSLNTEAGVALSVAFMLSVYFIALSKSLKKLISLFFLSVVVTIFYMMLGVYNDAPLIAIIQTSIIYIITPFFWIVIVAAMFNFVALKTLIYWAKILTILSVVSVAVFFYLFLNYGEESVLFYIKEPNINLQDGFSAATLHVYGSLIFFSGAFFSTPQIIKNYAVRYTLLASLVICGLTSGRSALIIAIFIGIFIGILHGEYSNIKIASSWTTKILSLFGIVLVGSIFYFYITTISEINFLIIIDNFIEKLLSGGGSERSEQAEALAHSVWSSYGLGAGHGIGVSSLRSEEFPWRYELIWLATLHRVGIFGFIVYAIPFVFCVSKFIADWRRNSISETDLFIFSGFLSALVASATNPYIEAFSFQWMYIVPLVYFLVYRIDFKYLSHVKK